MTAGLPVVRSSGLKKRSSISKLTGINKIGNAAEAVASARSNK
jgi:hypothetical protein